MRYTVYLVSVLMIIISCGKINEKIALDEIRKLEYTRNAHSQKLISYLNHKNPRIRLRAVEALGRIQDTSRAILLGNRLADESQSVRRSAAFALGQLFSPLAENHLFDAIRSEPSEDVRAKIVEALGKSGTERCFNLLKDYLESAKPSYREAATIACGILAYRGHPPFGNAFHLEVLLNAAQSSEVQWRAGYALYRLGNPSSFKTVYEVLNKAEDALLKHYVLRAINAMLKVMNSAQFQDFRNHPKMMEATQISQSREFYNTMAKLLNDESWFVRTAALELIGTLGHRFFNDEVINAMRDDHPYVRIEAIRTLANFNSAATRNELTKLYRSDQDWQIRGEALLTLTELDARSAFDILEAGFANGSSYPQNYYLIKSLEKISAGDYRPKSTRHLIRLADSGATPQQTLALEALVNRSEVPLEFMLEKLNTADPAITSIVATHLAFRKPAQAVDPLIEVYENFEAPRDVEAMMAIITALDSIRSPLAIPFLEEQLSNPFPPIQKQAQEALIRLTGISEFQIQAQSQEDLTKWDFELADFIQPPQVEIETNRGSITIELFPDKAPVTVANFLSLVQRGFYDSIYFHRVVPGFVIQGGDPRGDGWGGPGYSIPCEYNDTFYDRGTVGMAHAGKDTGGSQFFITHLPQPHLDGRYTAFGKVIEGTEVVDNIMVFDQIITCKLINNSTQN